VRAPAHELARVPPAFASFNKAARAFVKQRDVHTADPDPAAPKWPKLKYFIAPSPGNAVTQWLRKEAKLRATGAGDEALEVLLVDLRVVMQVQPAIYSMRGACQVERAGQPFGLAMLCDGGKALCNFAELFCSKIIAAKGDSPYLKPRVCAMLTA